MHNKGFTIQGQGSEPTTKSVPGSLAMALVSLGVTVILILIILAAHHWK